MDTNSKQPQTEKEDLEAASQSISDYSRFMPPIGKRPRHYSRATKSVLLGVLLLIVLGAGGYGVYKYVIHHHTTKPTTVKHAVTVKLPSTISTQTKNYSSQVQNVAFNYPSNWTVVENDTDNYITAQSPEMLLTAANGAKVKGKILMTIDQQTPDLPMFNKGNVLAVLPSQVITYKSPGTSQQGSAYVSFLQYPTTTAVGGLDAIYITGNSGYTQGQPIPQSDVAAVTPLVQITFEQCANAKCNGTMSALTIGSTDWSASSFAQPILDMLESFNFS